MGFAARVTDMHTCPMQMPSPGGPIPHVGGPVLPPGTPTVLIGGMPAACTGDMCLCAGVGLTDSIAAGSATVKIGGKPAVRQGDMTSHGGNILGFCPTVQIGG